MEIWVYEMEKWVYVPGSSFGLGLRFMVLDSCLSSSDCRSSSKVKCAVGGQAHISGIDA